MKCPYCNNEMLTGFIQSARDIVFGEIGTDVTLKQIAVQCVKEL